MSRLDSVEYASSPLSGVCLSVSCSHQTHYEGHPLFHYSHVDVWIQVSIQTLLHWRGNQLHDSAEQSYRDKVNRLRQTPLKHHTGGVHGTTLVTVYDGRFGVVLSVLVNTRNP